MENKKQIPWKFIIGLVLIAFAIYWIWRAAFLYIVFDMINELTSSSSLPFWYIIFNLVLGILGIPIGIQIIRGKINIKIGVIICIVMVLLTIASFLVI